MAARGSEAGYDQLRHFVAAGIWDSAPLEAALLIEADRLVVDPKAFLVADNTATPKKGRHSVDVATICFVAGQKREIAITSRHQLQGSESLPRAEQTFSSNHRCGI